MKITKVETIWHETAADVSRGTLGRHALPNNLWVRIHTDDGLVGLGETYYLPRAVASIIHDVCAPLLLGRSAFDIENHWNNMFSLVNFCGFAGAEMRAISAIDIALWDLLGQYTGQPIYNLLGGRNRESIAVYNTCVSHGKFPDYENVMGGKAGEVAASLLNQGIRAMKVWPFDQFGDTLTGPTQPRGKFKIWGGETAAGTLGHRLPSEELAQGIAVIESIRAAVGDKMAIAVEGHCRWDLPTAVKIARALESYNILWMEEMIPPDNADAYARLKSQCRMPICASERLFTRWGFRHIIEQNAADVIMPDLAWCGGFTETRKICSHADTYYLPVTLHDCIGPVAQLAAAHMMLHIPNAMIMESVRGYWDGGWYTDVVNEPFLIREGAMTLNGKPGLGAALRDEVIRAPWARVEVSNLDELAAR